MARCFIGIMMPEDVKIKIISIQNSLGRLPIACKMVERENLHLCLSFLGDMEENEINDICRKLDEISQRYKQFDADVSEIKFIPSEGYIRVLALGCSNTMLETISKNIKNEIGGDVKPPHVTLCRVKNIEEKQRTVEEIKKINSDVGKFTVSSIQLIKSELQKPGPVYSVIHESRLLE
jgi:2'-5' RNA ligase